MDTLVIIAFFAPLVLLIWALVRYANRIRRETVDRELRIQHLDNLNPAIVRFVLERDRHTCQRCGTRTQVGVDFVDETPQEGAEITSDDLQASCAECFMKRWTSLQDVSADREGESETDHRAS